MTNCLLLGSNFMSAQILTSLCGHDNTNVTIVDRKDPLVIRNINQDCVNIVKKYCYLPNYQISYRDVYEGTRFGDSKRNIFISFLFKDWVHEDISDLLKEADIVIHSGSVYDSIFASVNQKETVDVNMMGMINVLQQLRKVEPGSRKKLFVFMSSVNVYGDQSGVQEEEITEETTVPNPKDLLNISLFTEENLVKGLCNEDTEYMIFRLGTLCGYFTPHTSLVTSAVTALLDRKHHPEYTVYNGENSIELLDMNDLGMLINNLYVSYNKNDEGYQKSVNQVYNIKAEEKPEKTVRQIVETIMSTPKRLPHITREHGIKGISNFSLKPPKIVESFATEGPFIKFGKPVSADKAKALLGFLSMRPLVYSLITNTVQYLMTYILVDMKASERMALRKMFYLPSTPTPEDVDEVETSTGAEINKDVKKLVKDVSAGIAEAFDNDDVKENEI